MMNPCVHVLCYFCCCHYKVLGVQLKQCHLLTNQCTMYSIFECTELTYLLTYIMYNCSALVMATGPSSTCQAMESIRQYLSIGIFPLPCSFPLEHNCTAISCPLGFEGEELLIKLLRCNHPPAIEIAITDSSGNITYYHVFNHSEVVSLDSVSGFNGTALNVTLNELCSNEIGLKVNQTS